MHYSDSYVQHLANGPFPGQMDPWAEEAKYFHQIHAGMIGDLLERLRIPLMKMGYIAGREISLQITERSQPDILVQQMIESADPPHAWSYQSAAAEVLAEPGVSISPDEDPELDAVYIRRAQGNDSLVTILEIISPGNKLTQDRIAHYQVKREEFVRKKGINLVEVDLTRSVKHLVQDIMTRVYPYHIVVHLPEEARLIGINYDHALKRFALPLDHEVIAVEPQEVYDTAYRQASIAAQLDRNGQYSVRKLPFAALLTDLQKQDDWKKVEHWRATLEHLREQPYA